MVDVIHITVGEDHFARCAAETIARDGEGLVPRLVLDIPAKLAGLWAYLDFKHPNGERYKTPRLSVVDDQVSYDVPAYLLNGNGVLEVQLVMQNEVGVVWKSYVKKFNVRYSVNAVDDIPEKEDFIAAAQKLLDEISSAASRPAGVIGRVTLYGEKWMGTGSPYSQVVDIDGITERSKVDLNPSVEQLAVFHEKDLAFVAENEDGVITVYCVGQKPVGDYEMQITVTEVVDNG